MPRQDTVDFLTAFAVGTVLGIGATLLLQPERTAKQRVVRQWRPRPGMVRGRPGGQRGAGAASRAAADQITAAAITAGRELLGEFRAEVAEILREARAELTEMVAEEATGAKKARHGRG